MAQVMTDRALLSESQLNTFRSALGHRREAAFLAPQLLEQVVVLTSQLRTVLARLDEVRGAAADLTVAYETGQVTGNACPACHDVSLRVALKRLHIALGAPEDDA